MRNSSSIVITRNEKELGDLLDYVGKNTDYTWPGEGPPSRKAVSHYVEAKERGWVSEEDPFCLRFHYDTQTVRYGNLKLYERDYPHLPFLSCHQFVGGAIRRF